MEGEVRGKEAGEREEEERGRGAERTFYSFLPKGENRDGRKGERDQKREWVEGMGKGNKSQ